MPTVRRHGPYRLFFYSNEGFEPPHVHIEREGMAAKFWLRPVGLASNHGFAARELQTVYKIVRSLEKECWDAWHVHFRRAR
ncbi:MAG: DUF4160 domain-containing protein [Rhodospirillales bacterium]